MNSVSQKWRGSLCWCCRNVYDACAWSREGEQVKGWRAVRCDFPPQTKRGVPVKSFFVLQCPVFVLDDRFQKDYRRLEAMGRGGAQT